MSIHRPQRGRIGASQVAPLAWARALAFGLVSGGIGVLGHDVVASTPTHVPVLATAVLLATLLARPLACLRIDTGTMLVGVTAVQAVVHVSCIAVLDGRHGGAALHVRHHVASHFAGVPDLGSATVMLLAHALVIGLGVAVLCSLEAHAWDGMASIVRTLVARARAPRTSRAAACPPFLAPLTPTISTLRSRSLVGARGVRGPPARPATA